MSDLNDAELDDELTNLPEDVDDDDEEVAFLPFLALNEFMRDDYRMQVVRTALTALPNLPEPIRLPIERLTRQVVKVPGFRNSEKAPLLKRLRPTASAFEKSSAMVVAILAAWAEATPELRQLVYDLLSGDWLGRTTDRRRPHPASRLPDPLAQGPEFRNHQRCLCRPLSRIQRRQR